VLNVVMYGPGVVKIQTHHVKSGAEAHVPAPPDMAAPLTLPQGYTASLYARRRETAASAPAGVRKSGEAAAADPRRRARDNRRSRRIAPPVTAPLSERARRGIGAAAHGETWTMSKAAENSLLLHSVRVLF